MKRDMRFMNRDYQKRNMVYHLEKRVLTVFMNLSHVYGKTMLAEAKYSGNIIIKTFSLSFQNNLKRSAWNNFTRASIKYNLPLFERKLTRSIIIFMSISGMSSKNIYLTGVLRPTTFLLTGTAS